MELFVCVCVCVCVCVFVGGGGREGGRGVNTRSPDAGAQPMCSRQSSEYPLSLPLPLPTYPEGFVSG